jgi:hypothetical protein
MGVASTFVADLSGIEGLLGDWSATFALEAVSKRHVDAEEAAADSNGGKREEPAMDVGPSLVANEQSAETMHPREGSFNDPSVASEAFWRFDATARDAWDDAPCATQCPGLARIVGLVAMQLVGSKARFIPPSTFPPFLGRALILS